jgi:hypothetical protein
MVEPEATGTVGLRLRERPDLMEQTAPTVVAARAAVAVEPVVVPVAVYETCREGQEVRQRIEMGKRARPRLNISLQFTGARVAVAATTAMVQDQAP